MESASPNVNRLLYSIPDVCAATGLGRSFIYEMMSAGRLRSVKVGKRRLIPAEAIQQFLKDIQEAA